MVEHRTLNLMLLTFLFFFMRAAIAFCQLNSLTNCTEAHLRSILPAVAVLFNRRANFFLVSLLQPRGTDSASKLDRRTLGILAPADLDELLDVGNFGRHLDGIVWTSRWGSDREVRGRICPMVWSEHLAWMHGPPRGWPQALLLRAWWGDDVCGAPHGKARRLHGRWSAACFPRHT